MEILEQLGINPHLILVNIAGFLLLVWVLKKLLYKPVADMLASRAEDIQSTYSAAEAEKSAMEELRLSYEKRLSEIETEAHTRIQAAIKEAQNIRDEIITDARERSDTIIKRGEEELAREREKTIAELRQEVADLVIGASSRLIEESLDDARHRKLIDDFITSVGKTS